MAFAYIVCLWSLLSSAKTEFTKDFMSESCGTWLTSRISGRLETSTSLTYSNGMNCDVTISVSDNKRIILVFNRFEVEPAISGVCPDYLSLYDGLSTAFPLIYNRKCGTEVEPFTVNTSSNHVTFTFVSDSTAVYRGFEVEYTEFTEAPCTSGEFECARGICINEGNRCDDVNQCGDNSDESQCTDDEDTNVKSGWTLEEIIGCVIGTLILLIIIIVVAVKLYQYYKRKHSRVEYLSVSTLYEYPVTDKYNKYDIGIKGRREPRQVSFYSNVLVVPPGESSGAAKEVTS